VENAAQNDHDAAQNTTRNIEANTEANTEANERDPERSWGAPMGLGHEMIWTKEA
jgi:hypothetical protein